MNDYEIKKLYEEMETELIASMQRNFARHLKEESDVGFEYPQWQSEKLKEMKRYQRENRSIIGDYTKGLNKKISDQMHSELRQGAVNSIKEYNKLFPNDKKNVNKLLNRSFFKTNDKKVNKLIKVVNNDLKSANTACLRMMNDEYRQVIHKTTFYVSNGVMTEQKATQLATDELSQRKQTMLAYDKASKDFLSGGLNCIEYSNGRRVNIASYSAMAIRTANLRAYLMGEGDFRKSIGRSLVKVTTHGGACKLCTKWQGAVLVDDVYSGGEPDGVHQLLSEAMDEGFLHPNCRHGLTTYYPELEDISYDTEEEFEMPEDLQQQYSYYTRQEKRFDRLETGSITPSNVQDYHQSKINSNKKIEKVIDTSDAIEELTDESKEALEYYVSGEGMYINNVLRGINEELSLSDLTAEELKYLKALDNATKNDNIIYDKLYRSVDARAVFKDIDTFDYEDLRGYLSYGAKGEYSKNKLERLMNTQLDEFVDKGFVSTSRDYEIVKDWNGFTGSDRPIIMELHLNKNVKGIDLGYLDVPEDPQKEVLLARDQYFKIKSVETRDNKIYVIADVFNKKP